MSNRIKSIFNSVVSEIAMLLIACCMVGNALALNLYGEWTVTATASVLIGSAVLSSWLIWVVYILCTKRPVKEMPPRQLFFVQSISYILCLGWGYLVTDSFVYLIPFALLFACHQYLLAKEIREL